jgi:hypothetical protein
MNHVRCLKTESAMEGTNVQLGHPPLEEVGEQRAKPMLDGVG